MFARACGLRISACVSLLGRDSLADTTTHYGLDGRGSNHGRDELFRTHPYRVWAQLASCKMCNGFLCGGRGGVKRLVSGIEHPLLSGVEVKERV